MRWRGVNDSVSGSAARGTLIPASLISTGARVSVSRSFGPVLRFVNRQGTALMVAAIEKAHGIVHLFLCAHRHKAESTGTTAFAVKDDGDLGNLPGLRKQASEICFRRGERQIAYVHLITHFVSDSRGLVIPFSYFPKTGSQITTECDHSPDDSACLEIDSGSEHKSQAPSQGTTKQEVSKNIFPIAFISHRTTDDRARDPAEPASAAKSSEQKLRNHRKERFAGSPRVKGDQPVACCEIPTIPAINARNFLLVTGPSEVIRGRSTTPFSRNHGGTRGGENRRLRTFAANPDTRKEPQPIRVAALESGGGSRI